MWRDGWRGPVSCMQMTQCACLWGPLSAIAVPRLWALLQGQVARTLCECLGNLNGAGTSAYLYRLPHRGPQWPAVYTAPPGPNKGQGRVLLRCLGYSGYKVTWEWRALLCGASLPGVLEEPRACGSSLEYDCGGAKRVWVIPVLPVNSNPLKADQAHSPGSGSLPIPGGLLTLVLSPQCQSLTLSQHRALPMAVSSLPTSLPTPERATGIRMQGTRQIGGCLHKDSYRVVISLPCM